MSSVPPIPPKLCALLDAWGRKAQGNHAVLDVSKHLLRVALHDHYSLPAAVVAVGRDSGAVELTLRDPCAWPKVSGLDGVLDFLAGHLALSGLEATPVERAQPASLTVEIPTEGPPCALVLDVAAGPMRDVLALLDRKNKAYGDSASHPLRVFSRATPLEALLVRMDDKLSRLARGTQTEAVPEDTVMDLLGYLLIYLRESRKGKGGA